MRVLLLSAYAAQSHRYWCEGLRQMLPHWQWTVLELPPRHFAWRVRGNPLYWSIAERERLEQPHTLLIATSMVDLATLRGLVPSLSTIPTLLYFHENQFDYPQDRQQHSLLEAQMVSIYSALAADTIVFNSAYNRDSFLAGIAQLMARLPDRVPPGVVDLLRARSQVLPVPLLPADSHKADNPWPAREGKGPVRLLWSARFEHDKGGEGLHRVLQQLECTDLDYQLAVTGQQFRNSPPVFATIERDFAHRLVQFGFVESPARYAALQAGADMVLSTAVHEFQGLAVLQAVAAGCVPAVPDRLAYRELYSDEFRYRSCPGDPVGEAESAAQLIATMAGNLPAPPDVSAYALASLRQEYQCLLQRLQDSQPQPS